MVEERKRFQNGEPVEEEASPLRIVVGFLLTIMFTLLVIPFLFWGACIGIFSLGSGGWLVAGFVFVVILVAVAIRTKNTAVRVSTALVVVIAAVLAPGISKSMLLKYGNSQESIVFSGVAIVALLVFAAVRTRNPGVRWAIILFGAMLGAALLFLFRR